MSNARTENLLRRIEDIIIYILQSDPPRIVFNNCKLWTNVEFTDRWAVKSKNLTQTQIRFDHKNTRYIFTAILHLLSKIYKMILMNQCYTRRELYYEDVDIFPSQQTVDAAIQLICCILNCSPWEIGVMATSKGLVAGPLLIRNYDGNVIDCSSPGGTLIPFIICSDKTEIRTTAHCVLLIEKDTVFQKLLSENIFDKISDLLLVTGKGFPDVNTRMLVRKLSQDFKLPILALVDADPFGIAIMCVYKYGSLRMSSLSNSLVTPNLKWLGIHPSDIDKYKIKGVPLSQADKLKLNSLLEMLQHVSCNEQILNQLHILSEKGMKSEIEGLCKISSEFLINFYIRRKILSEEYI